MNSEDQPSSSEGSEDKTSTSSAGINESSIPTVIATDANKESDRICTALLSESIQTALLTAHATNLTSTSFAEVNKTPAPTAIATIAEGSETSLVIVKTIIEELIQKSISIAFATTAKTNRPSTSSAEISETTAITTTAEENETSHTIVTAIIDEIIQISTSDASCEEPKPISMYATPSMAETCEEPTSTTEISTEPNQISSSIISSAAGANKTPISTATATCAAPDPTSNLSTTSTYTGSVKAASAKTVNNHRRNQRYSQNWHRNATVHPPAPYVMNATPRCNYQPVQPSPPNFDNRASYSIPQVEQPYNMPEYSYNHPFSNQPLCNWYCSAPYMPPNSYLQQPSNNYEYSVPYYTSYQPNPITAPFGSFGAAPFVLPTPQTAYYPGPQGVYYESPDINRRTVESQMVHDRVTNTDAPVLNSDMLPGYDIRYPSDALSRTNNDDRSQALMPSAVNVMTNSYSNPKRQIKNESNIQVCQKRSTGQRTTRGKRRSRGKKSTPREPRESTDSPKQDILPHITSSPITLDMRESLSNAETKLSTKTSSTQQPDKSKQKSGQKKSPRKNPAPELTPREDTQSGEQDISSELVDKQEPEIGSPTNESPIQKTNEVLVNLPGEHNVNDEPESITQENYSITADSCAPVLDEKFTELKENKNELNESQETVTLVSKVMYIDKATQTAEYFESPKKTRDQSTQIYLDFVDQENKKHYPEEAKTKNEVNAQNEISGAEKKSVEVNPVEDNKTEERKTEKNKAGIPKDKRNKTGGKETENKKTEYKNENTKYNKPKISSYADVLKKKK